MLLSRAKSVICALLLLLGCGINVLALDDFISVGHFDLQVNFVPGEGWSTYTYDFGTGEQLDPRTTVYLFGSQALREVPDDPAFSLLGEPGDPIWLVPELYNPDIIYFGMGAPLLGRNIFTGGFSNRGRITMRMVSVTGTGPDAGGTVSMWRSGFPPVFYFSSADGIGPEDALDEITANFHAHYNWAFTQAGLYRITFEYSGTLLPQHGGRETSTQVTYTFDVGETPDASALRYAWPQPDGFAWSSWMGRVFTDHDPWIWEPGQGWIYFKPSETDSITIWTDRHGWAWTSQDCYPWIWRFDDNQWITL